jgi:hypothetical protein
VSYFHCSNGYPDRCNGYRGPLDEYVCLNPRHDAERVEARTPTLAARRGTAETGDDDE